MKGKIEDKNSPSVTSNHNEIRTGKEHAGNGGEEHGDCKRPPGNLSAPQITVVHTWVRRQIRLIPQQNYSNGRHEKREPIGNHTVPLQQLLFGPLGPEDNQEPDVETHTGRKRAHRQGDELFKDTGDDTTGSSKGIWDDSIAISKDEEGLVDVVEDGGDTENLKGIVDRPVVAVAYEKDEERDADVLEDQVESSFTGHDLLSSVRVLLLWLVMKVG